MVSECLRASHAACVKLCMHVCVLGICAGEMAAAVCGAVSLPRAAQRQHCGLMRITAHSWPKRPDDEGFVYSCTFAV